MLVFFLYIDFWYRVNSTFAVTLVFFRVVCSLHTHHYLFSTLLLFFFVVQLSSECYLINFFSQIIQYALQLNTCDEQEAFFVVYLICLFFYFVLSVFGSVGIFTVRHQIHLNWVDYSFLFYVNINICGICVCVCVCLCVSLA